MSHVSNFVHIFCIAMNFISSFPASNDISDHQEIRFNNLVQFCDQLVSSILIEVLNEMNVLTDTCVGQYNQIKQKCKQSWNRDHKYVSDKDVTISVCSERCENIQKIIHPDLTQYLAPTTVDKNLVSSPVISNVSPSFASCIANIAPAEEVTVDPQSKVNLGDSYQRMVTSSMPSHAAVCLPPPCQIGMKVSLPMLPPYEQDSHIQKLRRQKKKHGAKVFHKSHSSSMQDIDRRPPPPYPGRPVHRSLPDITTPSSKYHRRSWS